MEKLKIAATFSLAFGLVCFAAALVHFTLSIVNAIPRLSSDVTAVKEVIDPILDETRAIRELVPVIVAESEAIRAEVAPILAEVKAVRENIPPILSEWQATRTESLPQLIQETAAIRENLPELLSESQAYRELVDRGLVESAGYRELVPQVLSETQQVRELVPPTLDRVEALVAESKTIAATAGEDAVTGFFTGVIKSPFKLATGMSDKIFRHEKNLTAEENEILQSSIEHVVNVGTVGARQEFQSPNSNFKGHVVVLKDVVQNGNACRDLEISYRKSSRVSENKTVTVCHNQSGEWTVQ